MANFFELTVAFSCPSCRKENTIESAIESTSSDPAEAAKESTSLPLKCFVCKNLAPIGTELRVKVNIISATEYAAWIQGHQKTLRIHKEQRTPN
jgi:hypothetical protein